MALRNKQNIMLTKRRLKLWMMAAILSPAAMMTSCLDNIDNSVSPTYPCGESQAQAKFWEKFNPKGTLYLEPSKRIAIW